MRLLAYIRRSKESDERTVSLDTQRAEIDTYILRIGVAIAEVLIDDGISGGDRDRITRIKEKIIKGHLDGMVAYHLDRIARDTAAQLDLLSWFKRKKLEMHTCNQGLLSIEQSHEFLSIGVQAMLAEYVRKRAVERSIGISNHKRKTMQRYSRFAPYGYLFTPENDIIRNEDEQFTLEKIEMGTKHNLSATVLSQELNHQRLWNRKGTPWSPGSIARIQKRIVDENKIREEQKKNGY